MFSLRELDKNDIKEINKWRNSPELIALLAAPFRYINHVIDEKWYENYLINRNNAIRCAILDEERLLGVISLLGIDYINQSAELHIMIGDSQNYGKGAGTFAIKEMLNHAFSNLNLRRIELTVLNSNQRAKHVYGKIGFVKEGTKRSAVYKEGTFHDLELYSILKEEYTPSICRTNVSQISNFFIKKLDDGYLQTIVTLCDTAFGGKTVKRKDFLELILKWKMFGECFVANKDEIMGYCIIYANDCIRKVAYITMIGVRPEYQGNHVGYRLLTRVFEYSIMKGMDAVELEVLISNSKALEFYKSFGFKVVGKKSIHSYIMRKEIRRY